MTQCSGKRCGWYSAFSAGDMRATVCELVFQDGARVKATVSNGSPEADSPVAYKGAMDRLPRTLPESDNATLKVLFGNLAREMSARLDVSESGEFEEWAL